MISFDEIFAQYRDCAGLHETLTLRRGRDALTDVAVLGRVFSLADDKLDGGAQQMLRKAVILAFDTGGCAIALPIASNKDKLIWGDKVLTITSSDTGTRRIAGRLVAIELTLAGG